MLYHGVMLYIKTLERTRLDYALGATLLYGGDAETDQTAQGVRFKGDFNNNFILFAGDTLRYVF